MNEPAKKQTTPTTEAPQPVKHDIRHESGVLTNDASILGSALAADRAPAFAHERIKRAAGIIGNQSVLKLMEQGGELRKITASISDAPDIPELTAALSGTPDGEVCEVESL